MALSIQKTLLIKHVTGRFLLDTRKDVCDFTLEGSEKEGWKVNVFKADPAILKEIDRLQTELNLFYFEETGEAHARTIQKSWIYDTAAPKLNLDEAQQQLSLVLNTRISYSNEHVNTGN